MRKLTVILFIIFASVPSDIVAQWTNSGSGRINRTGGADRTSDGSGIFSTQGDWSLDAMISQHTSAQTLSGSQSWEGTSHVGMGASGWGSTALGAYNRASGVGAFVSGFMNVAGPTSSSIITIPPSTTNLGGQFAVGYATAATGHVAFTSGYSTTASGNYSTAMGESSTASGANSTALGKSTSATGNYSTSLGNGTTASGSQSTALGESSTASGYASLATGRSNTASGYNATAMGRASTASGYYSTVIGYNATASDFASFVIGQYNSSGSSATSAGSFDVSAPAFVIGNGTSGTASDAFKVMFNGDTYVSNSLYLGGTAITSSAAELNLLAGATVIGILGSVTEGSNTGVRLSTSTAANHGDTGSNAVDLSYQAYSSSSRGATGRYSTAAGEATTASGESSTALGYYSVASGGYGAIAMGNQTTASGANSTVMGEGGTASGAASTAMGRGTTASDYASLIIGQYNSSGSSATSATAFNTANTAFVIGNGVDSSNISDAFKVMFNGDATVSNDLTIGGDVVVSSDARLKANIVSLGSTIARLLLIDGKTYTMKKDGKQKIGVLAQDIQKVFPELVSEDDNEMLAVNYQGLVPVLINALKEQDDKISRLEVLVEKLMSDK